MFIPNRIIFEFAKLPDNNIYAIYRKTKVQVFYDLWKNIETVDLSQNKSRFPVCGQKFNIWKKWKLIFLGHANDLKECQAFWELDFHTLKSVVLRR